MAQILSYDDLYDAYKRASRWKTKKKEVQQWTERLDTNIQKLYDDIVMWVYQIWRTRRYIVQDPVVRELVVIPFRDRIVQHLISCYLTPLFEPQWIYDSYANRVGKWVLFGVRRVDHMIRSVSHNYAHKARILKCDIQSCFMSIDRSLVWRLITARIFASYVPWSKSLILMLVSHSLFHDYVSDRQDCTTHIQRTSLPNNKSMISCRLWCWLPLWNLTSHLFAQIVLHELDMFIKHKLHIKWYGRYVDDFILIHTDHDYLKWCITCIYDFFGSSLGLKLHPRKIYLQPVTTGMLFLGIYLKPWRRLIGRRVICNMEHRLLQYHINSNSHQMHKIQPVVNSYLGLVKHHDSLHVRRRFCRWLANQILRKIDFYHPYHKIIANPKPLSRKYQGEYWLYALI